MQVGDHLKRKITPEEAVLIMDGGVPMDFMTPATAVDTVAYPAVPQGINRIIRHCAVIGGNAANLGLYVVRETGDTHYIETMSHQVGFTSACTLRRPIMLNAGDTLTAADLSAGGNNVTTSMQYIDVRL